MAQEVATAEAMACEFEWPNVPSFGDCTAHKGDGLREMLFDVTRTMQDLPLATDEDLKDSDVAEINRIRSIGGGGHEVEQRANAASESISACSAKSFPLNRVSEDNQQLSSTRAEDVTAAEAMVYYQGRASDEPRLCERWGNRAFDEQLSGEHWVSHRLPKYRLPGAASTMPDLPSLNERVEYKGDGLREGLFSDSELPFLTDEDLAEFDGSESNWSVAASSIDVFPPDGLDEYNRVEEIKDETFSENDELIQCVRRRAVINLERANFNRSNVRRLGSRRMPARDNMP